jgi:hypothetical protein
MGRIASWLSEVEERPGRGLEELVQEICADAISWVEGGIQEWGDHPEPDEQFPVTTTLRIDGELHRNGVLISVADEAEVRRLASMLEMNVRDVLGRTGRDPALAYPLRVSIRTDEDIRILEVMY